MHSPLNSPSAERLLHRLASVDLNLLVPLLVIFEEQSVTRAATRLGLSQPALSHQLKRARVLLGDDLLIRQGNESRLTSRARNMIGPLRDLLEQAGSALDMPTFHPATAERMITLSATTSTSFVLMPHLLSTLAVEAPHVTLVARVPRDFDQDPFRNDDLDVLLLADGVLSPHRRERLYEDRWVAIAWAERSEPLDALTMHDVSTLPHVSFETGNFTRTPPYVVLDALGVRYRVQARVGDFLLIPLLITGTESIAIVQELVAIRLAEVWPLSILPLPFAVPALGMDVIWNPRLGRDPMRLWFDERLRDATLHAFRGVDTRG